MNDISIISRLRNENAHRNINLVVVDFLAMTAIFRSARNSEKHKQERDKFVHYILIKQEDCICVQTEPEEVRSVAIRLVVVTVEVIIRYSVHGDDFVCNHSSMRKKPEHD